MKETMAMVEGKLVPSSRVKMVFNRVLNKLVAELLSPEAAPAVQPAVPTQSGEQKKAIAEKVTAQIAALQRRKTILHGDIYEQ